MSRGVHSGAVRQVLRYGSKARRSRRVRKAARVVEQLPHRDAALDQADFSDRARARLRPRVGARRWRRRAWSRWRSESDAPGSWAPRWKDRPRLRPSPRRSPDGRRRRRLRGRRSREPRPDARRARPDDSGRADRLRGGRATASATRSCGSNGTSAPSTRCPDGKRACATWIVLSHVRRNDSATPSGRTAATISDLCASGASYLLEGDANGYIRLSESTNPWTR